MTDWTDEKYVEVWARLMGGDSHKKIAEKDGIYYVLLGGFDTKRADPLTDWNQCMMLVEKMNKNDFSMDLRQSYYDGWFWEVDLIGFEKLSAVHSTMDESPQRAIIRAVALAMEVE